MIGRPGPEKIDNNPDLTVFLSQLYLSLISQGVKNELPIESQLNTDRIEAIFGPVTAEIHHHDSKMRIIDIIDGDGHSTTHALTFFPQIDPSDDPLWREREQIKNGALIGKTMKAAGYQIGKPEIMRGTTELPQWLKERFQTDQSRAAYKIYQFICRIQSLRLLYGVVTEIYHPLLVPPSPEWSGKKTARLTAEQEMLATILRQYLA